MYDKVWKLEEMPLGLLALEKRETWGKAIIRVREEEGFARLVSSVMSSMEVRASDSQPG